MPSIASLIADSSQQLTRAGAPYEMTDREFNGIDYRVYKNTPATVKELLDVARAHGDNIFIKYDTEEWSFKRFFAQADAIGYQLVHRYNTKPGDRIAIAMRNYPEWMSCYVAIVSLGAIAVPLNSWGQREELEYGLHDAGASVVFCDQQRFDYIADSLQTLGTQAIVARADNAIEHPQAETLDAFIDGVSAVDMPVFELDSEAPVMILYTSGTTGKPKGAVSNHRNMIQAVYNFECCATISAMANPKAIEAMFASGNAPSSLLAVPLFHVSGLYAMFLLSLRGGRKIVMMYKWNPGRALSIIEREKITTLSAAPTMVMDMLEHPDFDKTDTSSLFALGSGGAATPSRFGELAYAKIDNVYPGTGYGMTESNAICSTGTGEAFRYKPRASGTVSPIVDVKTCDESGAELPRGATGEVWIKSPTVAKEYWNKPEASAETFVDGWLRTGDIGYVDDENFIFLVDRAKDIIIRSGENISAAEVEDCLHNHPAVWEVAAFSVPDKTHGEELAVAITFKPQQSATAEDIKQFIGKRLAAFKVPAIVHVRSEPMPRNATGKILKHILKQQYAAR